MEVEVVRVVRHEVVARKPFFLAFGAHRPHLPWNFPRRFWDAYPPTEQIALPAHEAAPEGMPPVAFTYELDGKATIQALNDTHATPFPDASTALPHNMTRTMRRGYYAAVSWCDFLIGELLDALETSGEADRTIVSLIGDHGEWAPSAHSYRRDHTIFR